MKKFALNLVGEEVINFLEHYVTLETSKTLVVCTANAFNIINHNGEITAIVNFGKANQIRYINKFFETVNERLENDQLYIFPFETIVARKARHSRAIRIPIIRSFYFWFEFFFFRFMPKVRGLKKIYFFLTRGKIRLLTRAEVFGRLVSCGFEILDFRNINGITYVVSKKVTAPRFDMEPSYGMLFKMKRVGKGGKIIGVYKLRTMHPYAEYLQDYVLNIHGYDKTGKPKNDFRLTPWGRVLRKYWLDELPQLLNVLKGEMKLVGVRPISERYMQDIPVDLRELRLRHKPGCIPPYVALDRKGTVEEVLQAEREYLLEKSNRPYTTDIRFFFRALWNIVVKRKRSA
jgi:lipopolysaccharide/colanic/teichoic acid biosynthesis glycosyltransferase